MAKASYDYIIVGGGSAGCVLANRLSEDPDCRVLLLEAGGRDNNLLFHWPAGFARMTKGLASWGWSTVPQRHMQNRQLWFTQAKVVGGGSSINAQLYNRGNRQDFDRWAKEVGDEAWGYEAVLGYFKRSEGNERFEDAYHSGYGPLGVSMPRGALPICDAFIRAGQEWGLPYNPDFNGASQEGVGYYQLTQRDARRSSTATAFLRPALGRKNLTLRTSAEVVRLLVEAAGPGGPRITGVKLAGRDEEKLFADQGVILAAGAIGSPRLLLLSGIGPADELSALGLPVRHDLPGVGRNLQDHLDLCTIFECSGPYSYDGFDRWHKSALAGLQYLLTKTGPVTASLFETGGFATADPDATAPDIQFHLGQGSGIEKGIAKIKGWGLTLNSAYLRPRSRGSVRLASSDPSQAPLIDPNFWADPFDRDMSLRGLEMAREILSQPALKPFLRSEFLPSPKVKSQSELIDYACRMAKTDHHPVGTCRMGQGAEAVVAPDLRLHGMAGLRVCDASVMPSLPSANTNAAAIMIAEKGADLARGITAI